MAYTQAEIDALKSAIASGALTVKFDDLTTTYRDLDEMNEILGNMEKEVNEDAGTRKRRITYIKSKKDL